MQIDNDDDNALYQKQKKFGCTTVEFLINCVSIGRFPLIPGL